MPRIVASFQWTALAFCFCFTAQAQDIKISEGVVDFQVLQRNAEEHADLKFGGTAAKKVEGKYIEARISANGNAVTSFDWTPMVKAKNGKWDGEFKGLPTGGPYRLEARITGTTAVTAVEDLLVGDLWILAGQSNMEGFADLVDVITPIPLVHSFDMADQWAIAREPLHTLVSAADPVHWVKNDKGQPERYSAEKLSDYLSNRKKGAGLGLPFAEEMLRRTGVPVGLIPCAHGGTSMDQWDPALRDKGGESLYGSMVRRFRATGGKVKGVLWYQGESDATAQAAPKFMDKFQRFVAAVRADFGQPDLPFYYVQIGRVVEKGNEVEWNAVQDAQRKSEAAIPHSGMVASIDLSLDDWIHVSTPDLKRLGFRLANLAAHDLFPAVKQYAEMKGGPRPVAAKYANGSVRVQFNEVNGRLLAEGRLNGFEIHSATGEYLPIVYKQRFDASDPNTVILDVQGKLPDKSVLWYGFGKNPYCNLRDMADMAAPLFGPLAIQ